MKIKLLFTLVLSAGISLFISAQSIQLIKNGSPITSGSTQLVLGDTTVTPLVFHIDVKNIASSTKRIMVKKYDVTLLGMAESYFCWAQCYPNFVYTSLEAIGLTPGQTTSNFSGDLDHYLALGTHRVCYTFYDSLNVNDSASVCVDFRVTGVGINDINAVNVQLSNAFPNPAKNATSFRYVMSDYKSGSYAAVYNMVGSIIATIPVMSKEGLLQIPVSELQNGLYFFTIVVDGKNTSTRKFTVNH